MSNPYGRAGRQADKSLTAEAPAAPAAVQSAVAPPIPATEPPRKVSWTVRDSNASDASGPRKHQTNAGRVLSFGPGEDVPMTKEEALGFLRDASFVVKDGNGEVYKAAANTALPGSTLLPKAIPSGHVIAALEELSDEALTRRAVFYSGGHAVSKSGTRQQKIEFIVAAEAAVNAPVEEKNSSANGLAA